MRAHGELDGDSVVVHVDGARVDTARIGPVAVAGPGVDPGGIEPVGLVADGDLTLIAALLPAMRSGAALRLDQPVSAGLLATVRHVQDVFCTWDRFLRPTRRWYHPVEVTAPVRAISVEPGSATACLFTGGVDSFHTVLTQADRIDALVYVHGFDVALDDLAARRRVSARLGEAAEALGLPLVELASDLQGLGERWAVGWDDYHGAALAAVGTALSRRFGRLLVPATHTYAHLEGLGSHPLVDPWWSGDRLVVEHVGAQATRVDKVRVLAGSAVARRFLRVCWENRDGRDDCGRCEKCVRTGVAVRLAGAEGTFATVRAPSLHEVATVRVTGRGSAWHELRNELVAQGTAPRLRRAIDVALARHQLRRWRFTGKVFR